MAEATNGLNNAVPYKWTYANAAARVADTGLDAADIGKWARQDDDNSYWTLTATTPTWAQVGGSAISGTAGHVPFIAGGGSGISTDTGLHWDNTAKTLQVTQVQATAATGHTAVNGTTDTAVGVDGEASGAGGWGVYGFADGTNGRGVVAEAGAPAVIALETLGATLLGSYVDLTAITAPAAPASGVVRLYVDVADGHLKFKKNGGAVVDLG